MTDGYLDHATTSSPKAPGVAEAVAASLREPYSSPGRSAHGAARAADAVVESARQAVTQLCGTHDPARVVFTHGATHALNLAIKGLLRTGDHAIATCFDHNSVLRPLASLSREGCLVSIARSPRPDAELIAAVLREVRPETRLIVLPHASNVCGAVLPLTPGLDEVRAAGVLILLDAAQTVGTLPLDLSALPVDLVAFGAHKGLLGPPGVGCLLFNRPGLELRPLLDGGTGHDSAAALPSRTAPIAYEAGTANLPAIAGLLAALTFVRSPEHTLARQTASRLHRECAKRLLRMPHVTVYGDPLGVPTLPVIAFNVAGRLPEQVAEALDEKFDLQTRSGLHCAPLAHHALGSGQYGSVRAMFGLGNDERTLTRFLEAMSTLRRS